MLRDGSYLEADKLEIGQSLMPLYFINNEKFAKGYEQVKLNSHKEPYYESVYKVVANTILKNEIDEAQLRSGEDIISIHHKDFNKLNNYPSNLFPMGHKEHIKYHADFISYRRKIDKEFDKKLREVARQNMIKLNINPTKKLIKSRKNKTNINLRRA